MECGLTHLTVGLTGRKEGLEGESKPNDVEETSWHQALENDQQGILRGGKQTDISTLGLSLAAPTSAVKALPRAIPPSSDNKPTASFPCLHMTPLFSKSPDVIWDLKQ